MSEFTKNFIEILSSHGLADFANEALATDFQRLTALLLATNAHTNLTAIKEEKEIILKHYADCLAVAHLIPRGAKLLDVGCGGGFPTLPLAIARKDLQILALDSTAKKLEFVSKCAKELNLNVTVLAGRAEELGKETSYREEFDVVTARAVAALPVLSEWCLPFVRVGGIFLAMKGSAGKEELDSAQKAIPLLGGRISQIEEPIIGQAKRCNILISKVAPTPKIYPRKNSLILKKPL